MYDSEARHVLITKSTTADLSCARKMFSTTVSQPMSVTEQAEEANLTTKSIRYPPNVITEPIEHKFQLPYKTNHSGMEYHVSARMQLQHMSFSSKNLSYTGHISGWDCTDTVMKILSNIDEPLKGFGAKMHQFFGKPSFKTPLVNATDQFRSRKLPYIHVRSVEGPRITYEFHSETFQGFLCEFEAVPGNELYGAQVHVLAGPIAPKTPKTRNMDIAFGIVFRANLPNSDGTQRVVSIMEFIMVPRSVQCVKFDWSPPLKHKMKSVSDKLALKNFQGAQCMCLIEKTRLTFPGVEFSVKFAPLGWENHLLSVKVRELMPPMFKREFLLSKGINKGTNAAYASLFGPFLINSLLVQYTTEFYKRLLFSLIVEEFSFATLEGFLEKHGSVILSECEATAAAEMEASTRNSTDAETIKKFSIMTAVQEQLSLVLHHTFGLFPFGQGMVKYQTYDDDYRVLANVIHLCFCLLLRESTGWTTTEFNSNAEAHRVSGGSDREFASELEKVSAMLAPVYNHIMNGMGLNETAGNTKTNNQIVLISMIENMQHVIDQPEMIDPHDIRMHEYAVPARLATVRLPLRCDSFRCDFDFSDLNDNVKGPLQTFYPCERWTQPLRDRTGHYIKTEFTDLATRQALRSYLTGKNDMANQYFQTITLNVDNRLVQWTTMQYHPGPQRHIADLEEAAEALNAMSRRTGLRSASSQHNSIYVSSTVNRSEALRLSTASTPYSRSVEPERFVDVNGVLIEEEIDTDKTDHDQEFQQISGVAFQTMVNISTGSTYYGSNNIKYASSTTNSNQLQELVFQYKPKAVFMHDLAHFYLRKCPFKVVNGDKRQDVKVVTSLAWHKDVSGKYHLVAHFECSTGFNTHWTHKSAEMMIVSHQQDKYREDFAAILVKMNKILTEQCQAMQDSVQRAATPGPSRQATPFAVTELDSVFEEKLSHLDTYLKSLVEDLKIKNMTLTRTGKITVQVSQNTHVVKNYIIHYEKNRNELQMYLYSSELGGIYDKSSRQTLSDSFAQLTSDIKTLRPIGSLKPQWTTIDAALLLLPGGCTHTQYDTHVVIHKMHETVLAYPSTRGVCVAKVDEDNSSFYTDEECMNADSPAATLANKIGILLTVKATTVTDELVYKTVEKYLNDLAATYDNYSVSLEGDASGNAYTVYSFTAGSKEYEFQLHKAEVSFGLKDGNTAISSLKLSSIKTEAQMKGLDEAVMDAFRPFKEAVTSTISK